jgi:hypothetical protein
MVESASVSGIFNVIKKGKYIRVILILMVVYSMSTLNLYAVSYAL